MNINYLLNFAFIIVIICLFISCETTPTPNTSANTTSTNKNSVISALPKNTTTPAISQPITTPATSQATATPIPENTRLVIEPNRSSTPSAVTQVTIEKFEKLKIGMDYKEAARILGSPGTTQGALKTQTGAMQMYSWKGKTDKGDWNITARFDKGKLVNKVQFGLK